MTTKSHGLAGSTAFRFSGVRVALGNSAFLRTWHGRRAKAAQLARPAPASTESVRDFTEVERLDLKPPGDARTSNQRLGVKPLHLP
jgi:hypothetical protein